MYKTKQLDYWKDEYFENSSDLGSFVHGCLVEAVQEFYYHGAPLSEQQFKDTVKSCIGFVCEEYSSFFSDNIDEDEYYDDEY